MARKKRTSQIDPVPGKGHADLPTIIAGILLTLGFVYLAVTATPFLQDDAYISFRYVQNYQHGDGLVFNAGERVEGYTNFLWIIILSVAVKIGFELTAAARWLGILFMAGSVAVTTLLARRVLAGYSSRWVLLGVGAAGAWVAVNPAMSYWSVAGLETGLFVFLITLAVERLLAGWPLCWWLLALATLTRPEGALAFIICAAWFLLRDLPAIKHKWRRPAMYYVLPLLPFAVFKLVYYGSLFPNPFYAKTGFSPEYWQSGLEYLWLHLQHFGLWGVLPLVLLAGLLRARWKSPLGLAALFWLIYTIYVVSIGGDVLRAHRFFVPIWPLFVVAVVGGMIGFMQRMKQQKIVWAGMAVIFAAVSGYEWFYPQGYFIQSRSLENSLVHKMWMISGALLAHEDGPFSVAASTIGRLGYDLRGHDVIDMLGLTDSTIARHPETISGMSTTWKERHFNAGHVLSRQPDFIIFSTGVKPSAQAERALILHSTFRRNYFTALYSDAQSMQFQPVFKRIGETDRPDSVWPDMSLADELNTAMNHRNKNELRESIVALSRMKTNGPGDFALPDVFIADAYINLGEYDKGMAHADSALAINPSSVAALVWKRKIYHKLGDSTGVSTINRQIAGMCPWLALK